MTSCPNAMPPRVYQAFTWWFEFREYRILPFSGFDFAGQPAFVAQAIRIGETEIVKVKPIEAPPKPPPR